MKPTLVSALQVAAVTTHLCVNQHFPTLTPTQPYNSMQHHNINNLPPYHSNSYVITECSVVEPSINIQRISLFKSHV